MRLFGCKRIRTASIGLTLAICDSITQNTAERSALSLSPAGAGAGSLLQYSVTARYFPAGAGGVRQILFCKERCPWNMPLHF